MKIKFESDDDLPLGETLNIPVCVITVRSVFQKKNKYYPQVFLHECLLSMSMNLKMVLM